MRSRPGFAAAVLGVALGWGLASASAAEPVTSDAPPVARLLPTPTCPQPAVDELNRTIDFVRGQTWTARPGSNALALSPDVNACRVVLHVGELTPEEKAALQAGAGSRLAIEYRKDWARPSRLLLILWIIFGGSGLASVYWRYARR